MNRNVRIHARNNILNAGPGCKTLVMALIGASHTRQFCDQAKKIQVLVSLPEPPNIIGDLSIVCPAKGKPLWRQIVEETPIAAACLPVYTIENHRNGQISPNELLDVTIEQMEAGVGLITIHPTPCQKIQTLAQNRLTPCTSRGGGLIIADLESRSWEEDNVYLKILPEIIAHAKKNQTVLSIGASYRSGNIFDSGDAAQLAEIELQIQLALNINDQGVGVIIESPGHARPRDIKRIASILRSTEFPIMPLGPIPTDTAIGQDHIASAIGGTLMGLEDCGHILAAVTREEHTGGIPTAESTIEAVVAARIAAHIIDLELSNDDHSDRAIALARSRTRSCVVAKQTHGCDRCARACPL